MAQEHVSITDPEIHEPKGISGASQGQVYVADGAGSGNWKEYLPQGWALYHDSGAAQALSTTAAKITIDGSGADNDETHLPTEIRGSGSLWSTADNKITPIAEGDSYLCSLDFNVTVSSTASYLIFELDVGGGASPSNVLVTQVFPLFGSVPYQRGFNFSVPVTSDFNTNGGQLFVSADVGTPEIDDIKLFINRLYAGDL